MERNRFICERNHLKFLLKIERNRLIFEQFLSKIWGPRGHPGRGPSSSPASPGGTRVISLNFEIDNVKLDPLPDDLLEAVTDFLEKVGIEHPKLLWFICVFQASVYLYPILKGFEAKVRNRKYLRCFTATDRRNHILNSLGKHFTRADLSIRDGIHFSKAD